MIVFVLLQDVPPLLGLTLLALVWLTWIEIRHEPISFQGKVWWCLLVFLFNVVGYVVMRLYFLVARRRRAEAEAAAAAAEPRPRPRARKR